MAASESQRLSSSYYGDSGTDGRQHSHSDRTEEQQHVWIESFPIPTVSNRMLPPSLASGCRRKTLHSPVPLPAVKLSVSRVTATLVLFLLASTEGYLQGRRQPLGRKIHLAALLPTNNARFPFAYQKVFPALQLSVRKVTALGGPLHGRDIQVHFRNSECSSAAAMNQMYNFYIQKHVDVFFGPCCDYAAAPVGRQLHYWNVPMLTAGAIASDFAAGKTKFFNQVTRVGVSVNSLIDCLLGVMQKFGWKRIKQVYEPFAQGVVGEKVCHIMTDGIHYGLKYQTIIPDIEQDYEKVDIVEEFLERMPEEIGDWGRPDAERASVTSGAVWLGTGRAPSLRLLPHSTSRLQDDVYKHIMELGILHNSPPSTKRGCRAGRLHRLWHGLPPAPWPCTRSQHHSVPSRNLHPLMVPPFLQPHPDLQSAVGNAPLSSKHPAQLPTTDCLLSIISPMGGQPSDAPALSPPSPLQQGGQSSNAPALSPPSPLPQGGQPIALALSPPSLPPQGGQPSDAPGLSPSSSLLLLCQSDSTLNICHLNSQSAVKTVPEGTDQSPAVLCPVCCLYPTLSGYVHGKLDWEHFSCYSQFSPN
ncbi:hypothetical protein ACOMHN_010522 [Nucella lapillus]